MKKIGVIYGSTTGTTESVARLVADKLGVSSSDIHDVSNITPELINEYDFVVLGTSTWGDGELQDDWYDGIDVLKSSDLKGKMVALFGCGDSESYSDTFCDAMGVLYQDLQACGCDIVGMVDASGYNYSSSVSVVDGKFVGLAIDEMNESDMTEERVSAWTDYLKSLIS